MRIVLYLLVTLSLAACSQDVMEELAFRKTMEYQLKDDCAEDEACIAAVENQIKECMDTSNWREYIERQDDEEALADFIKSFFPCFKDDDGNAYFELNQEQDQNDQDSKEPEKLSQTLEE